MDHLWLLNWMAVYSRYVTLHTEMFVEEITVVHQQTKSVCLANIILANTPQYVDEGWTNIALLLSWVT